MITAIKDKDIRLAYRDLFEEATDILSGYKKVRTYDAKITEYYYKETIPVTDFENLFVKIDSIINLTTFT